MRFFLADTLPKVGYGWSICDRRDVKKFIGRAVIAACCFGVVGLELQPLGLGRSYTQVQFFELLDSNVLRVFQRNCFILFLIALQRQLGLLQLRTQARCFIEQETPCYFCSVALSFKVPPDKLLDQQLRNFLRHDRGTVIDGNIN